MLDREDRIIDINIEDEMKTAYIDYSMLSLVPFLMYVMVLSPYIVVYSMR